MDDLGDIPMDAHIRLKVTGSPQKIAAFNWVMGTLDPDYPLGPRKLRRHAERNVVCDECHGLIYYTPLLTPRQVINLGKQIHTCAKLEGHLKVKILMFNIKCTGRALGTVS